MEIALTGLVAAKGLRFTREDCLDAAPAHLVDGAPAALGAGARSVRFLALIERADPPIDARWVTCESADGSWSVSLPIEEVADVGLVAFEVDGEPLAPERGGPFRLILSDYRDPCASVRDLARVDFADAPGRDTRPSRRSVDGPTCGPGE